MEEYLLDLCRYACPLPLLMTKKALAALPAGAVLRIRLNRASSEEDFRELCRKLGYRFISSENSGEGRELYIGK